VVPLRPFDKLRASGFTTGYQLPSLRLEEPLRPFDKLRASGFTTGYQLPSLRLEERSSLTAWRPDLATR
jgi:hypothetical protein